MPVSVCVASTSNKMRGKTGLVFAYCSWRPNRADRPRPHAQFSEKTNWQNKLFTKSRVEQAETVIKRHDDISERFRNFEDQSFPKLRRSTSPWLRNDYIT